MQVCLNYGVWDIETGNLLKLGEDKEVLQAMHGKRKLTMDEIKAVYGSPVPRFAAVNWPQTHNLPLKETDTV